MPFTLALVIMLAIGLIELLALLVGTSISSALDSMLPDVGIDAPDLSGADPGPLSLVLGWLSIGQVPALVALVLGLCGFAVSGLAIQLTAQALLGTAFPALLAAIPALAAAAWSMRLGGRALGPLFGTGHSEAASRADFVGSFATIIRGTARRGLPAEAKTTDGRGRTHYLLIEPDSDGVTFEAGARVFIVGQTGTVYRAIDRLKSDTPANPISKQN